MPTLFSYRIRYDGGSAPNPFWGLCTLAICKPVIRRAAEVGDWVVGTGSSVAPIGDISNKVVYAMRVTQKMTMEEYDEFTRSKFRLKIPRMTSTDPRRRSGDSIYDYSLCDNINSYPSLRPSVHKEWNQKIDLSGKYVLLSNHFFYFGSQPVTLPDELSGIVKKGQGHKANFDPQYVNNFIGWLHNLGYQPATINGKPLSEVEMRCPDSACSPQDKKINKIEPDSLPNNCG